jgi:hypothetical protein
MLNKKVRKNSSWIKEIKGGTPKFDNKKTKNPSPQNIDRKKELDKKTICRDWVIWNISPTNQNIILEITSWVKKNKTLNTLPKVKSKKIIVPIKFIWQIEEKATNPFLSLCSEALKGESNIPQNKKNREIRQKILK